MPFVIPTASGQDGKEFSTEPTGGSFNNIDKPGKYHVEVTSVVEEDKYIIDFGVLGAAATDQLDKTLREWLGANQRDQAYSFAIATGLLKIEEVKLAKKAGNDIPFEPKHAVGRQLVIDVDWNEYQGKNTMKITYKGFFAIDHPEIPDEIINRGALKAAGDAGNNPFEAGEQGEEVAAGKEDEFGGLFD